LFSNLAAALVWVPLLVLGRLNPEMLPHPQLLVGPITAMEHGLLFLKSCLVGSSWLFAYFAVKHLPISIAGSVRSTGPVFTIVGALMLFSFPVPLAVEHTSHRPGPFSGRLFLFQSHGRPGCHGVSHCLPSAGSRSGNLFCRDLPLQRKTLFPKASLCVRNPSRHPDNSYELGGPKT